MRLGIDLRVVAGAGERLELAKEADRLGLWAVLVGRSAGTEVTEAAAIATATDYIHIATWLDATAEHPFTLAEEVSILDHLSARRALAVIDGPPEVSTLVDRFLSGEIVDGVALTPPPAQTNVPVWEARATATLDLTGDLEVDRPKIDAQRDAGVRHLFVTWPGPLAVLARHLATRALTADFPQIVADLADTIEPL